MVTFASRLCASHASRTAHAISTRRLIIRSDPVRAVDVFVEALDLHDLEFVNIDPAVTGRPAYRRSPLLELYICGWLNRVHPVTRMLTSG